MTSLNEACARILEAAANLPSPSPVLDRLVSFAERRDVALSELERTFGEDPALVTRLIQTVNSAAYRRRTEVSSIAHAVRLLGVDKLIEMAMEQIARTLAKGELRAYDATGDDLWAHAQLMALAGKQLATHTMRADLSGRVYIAALLADIGTVVLALALPEATPPSPTDLASHATYLDYERATYGVAHTEVGAALATHWRLPAWLGAAIEFHHDPESCPEAHREIAGLVHAADAVASGVAGGFGSMGQHFTIQPTLETLGIDADVILFAMLSLAEVVRSKASVEARAEAQ